MMLRKCTKIIAAITCIYVMAAAVVVGSSNYAESVTLSMADACSGFVPNGWLNIRHGYTPRWLGDVSSPPHTQVILSHKHYEKILFSYLTPSEIQNITEYRDKFDNSRFLTPDTRSLLSRVLDEINYVHSPPKHHFHPLVSILVLYPLAVVAVALLTIYWSRPTLRFGMFTTSSAISFFLQVAFRLVPLAAICLASHQMMILFWDNLIFLALKRRNSLFNDLWIMHTEATLALGGLGLFLLFFIASMIITRRYINKRMRDGFGDFITDSPASSHCIVCGYLLETLARCPECGTTAENPNTILLLWPRLLGTPTRRKSVRLFLALSLLGFTLVLSPLLIGIAHVVFKATF